MNIHTFQFCCHQLRSDKISNRLHWYRLDGKHCVFGKVLDDASMLVVRKCEAVPVSGSKGKPRLTLRIAESGEL
mgnify:CR=1 FL=1